MHECAYVFTYTCIYAYMYIRLCVLCICILYTFRYICIYVYMYIRVSVCMYICMYVYTNVCMYVCMHVCMRRRWLLRRLRVDMACVLPFVKGLGWEKRVTGLRYLLVVRRPSQQMKNMRTLF